MVVGLPFSEGRFEYMCSFAGILKLKSTLKFLPSDGDPTFIDTSAAAAKTAETASSAAARKLAKAFFR